MIQRIQSLYLLIAAILTALLLKWPFAEFLIDSTVYVFKAGSIEASDGSFLLVKTLPLLILLIIILGLTVVTVFLYKKRTLQMRLTIFSILLTLGIYALFYYYYNQAMSLKSLTFSYDIGLVIPLVNGILLFLAFRGIKKDDEVIKSLDRIR
jgi:hypothetical protein